jgi:hypothetical protein
MKDECRIKQPMCEWHARCPFPRMLWGTHHVFGKYVFVGGSAVREEHMGLARSREQFKASERGSNAGNTNDREKREIRPPHSAGFEPDDFPPLMAAL